MDRIDTFDMKASSIGNLFRDCGDGGEGTPIDAKYMNGLMMEMMNVIAKSCQTPVAFDQNDPASYDQVWQSIIKKGGSCGVPEWSDGNLSRIVVGSDCQYYFLRYGGDPTIDPVGDDGSWHGPFCSVGLMLSAISTIYASQEQVDTGAPLVEAAIAPEIHKNFHRVINQDTVNTTVPSGFFYVVGASYLISNQRESGWLTAKAVASFNSVTAFSVAIRQNGVIVQDTRHTGLSGNGLYVEDVIHPVFLNTGDLVEVLIAQSNASSSDLVVENRITLWR